ncbi:hypothetical protein C3744_28505, partial [Priestia megaterium]
YKGSIPLQGSFLWLYMIMFNLNLELFFLSNIVRIKRFLCVLFCLTLEIKVMIKYGSGAKTPR